MRIKSFKLVLVAALSLFTFASGAGSLALAHDLSDNTAKPQIHTEAENESLNCLSQQQNACRGHERVINASMQRIAARDAKHMEVFNKIATRVESFASTKGQKPSNYDALVAEVDAKKAAAQAALDKIKSDSVSFKCDGSDPKGAAQGFKAELKAEIAALKDYKTAIKNLIVAVKSANSATNSTTTGGSEQ